MVEKLRQECGGLDRLNRASLVTLLLAMDEASGDLRSRIEYAIANYGR
ncbi:hypothetical protein LBMAG52_43200 [Planctomycetia bacterium]|nr:hypothetical protein LBMAG52_43200 [Planctomycetia bacterium]